MVDDIAQLLTTEGCCENFEYLGPVYLHVIVYRIVAMYLTR